MAPTDEVGPSAHATDNPRSSTANPLRVCIVSTHFAPETTGNAPYAASLAHGLARLGHEVSVLAGAPHYPGWAIWPSNEWTRDETRDGVSIRRFQSYVPSRPNFLRRVLYETGFGARFSAHAPLNADVVVLLSPSLFAASLVRLRYWFAPRRPRTVLWMQDLYSAGVRETPGRAAAPLAAIMTAIEGRLARSCDEVAVIHDRFRHYVTNQLGVVPERVTVIRNWTHIDVPTRVDVEHIRERFNWAADEVVVLHAGNMGAKQGLENVVDAARVAEATETHVRFVLLGDGNQRAELERRGEGCTHLQFIDPLPQEEFLEALAAADVLLVNERPSLNEAAVPSKLTTYFATGHPVVAATDAASTTSDEMRASGAGAIVPPADPESLVKGALSIAATWSKSDAARGPAYVREHLAEEACIRAFALLLHAGNHPPTPHGSPIITMEGVSR